MKKHTHSHNQEIEQIVHDYKNMNREEFEDLYGVEFEGKKVYDTVLNKTYPFFEEWLADQSTEADYEEYEISHQTSRRFDEVGC